MRLLTIIKWPFTKTSGDEKWINAFVDWFGSISGFKQQMIFMFGWILIVLVYPNIDPNMLHLMAFLTIYSGITQPMIAIQNTHTGEMQIRMMKSQQIQIEAMKAMIEAMQNGGRTDEQGH